MIGAIVGDAVWLRGDADTQACIAGAAAEAFYGGVPRYLAGPALALLTEEMRALIGKFEGIKK
jgi:ADP-ribosylglycohydrolase